MMIPECLAMVRAMYPQHSVCCEVFQWFFNHSEKMNDMVFRVAICGNNQDIVGFTRTSFEECVEAIRAWDGVFK